MCQSHKDKYHIFSLIYESRENKISGKNFFKTQGHESERGTTSVRIKDPLVPETDTGETEKILTSNFF
jgi:hypothetical protein